MKLNRFFQVLVPTAYTGQRTRDDFYSPKKEFEGRLNYSIAHMMECLSNERLGGSCYFQLKGSSEAMLWEDLLQFVQGLVAQEHMVTIETNGMITPCIDKLVQLPKEITKNILISFSLDYLELQSQSLLGEYFSNVKKIKQAGISFTVAIEPDHAYTYHLIEMQMDMMRELGAVCHVSECREEYANTSGYTEVVRDIVAKKADWRWDEFESPLLKHHKELANPDVIGKHFCYSGDYILHLNLGSGRLSACGSPRQNIFHNPREQIQFGAVGKACPMSYCRYAKHAELLAGAITLSEHNHISYADVLNRTCTDGSEWLTEFHKEVFSRKISENHASYSKERKDYLNVAMKMLNRRPLYVTSPEEYRHVAKLVIEKLEILGYKKVAIYGMLKLGWWFSEILKGSSIELAYGIDIRCGEIPVEDIKMVHPDMELEPVDAVIVTTMLHFDKVNELLQHKMDTKIINFLDLI